MKFWNRANISLTVIVQHPVTQHTRKRLSLDV